MAISTTSGGTGLCFAVWNLLPLHRFGVSCGRFSEKTRKEHHRKVRWYRHSVYWLHPASLCMSKRVAGWPIYAPCEVCRGSNLSWNEVVDRMQDNYADYHWIVVNSEFMFFSLPGRTGGGSPVCSYCFLDGGACQSYLQALNWFYFTTCKHSAVSKWFHVRDNWKTKSSPAVTTNVQSLLRAWFPWLSSLLAAEFLFRSGFASYPGGVVHFYLSEFCIDWNILGSQSCRTTSSMSKCTRTTMRSGCKIALLV